MMNTKMNLIASDLKNTIVQPIVEAFTEMYHDLAGFLPHLIVGAIIVFVGYAVAAMLQKVLNAGLITLKFDEALERLGITKALAKVGLKSSPSVVIAKTCFWLVMLFVVKNAAAKLGVKDVELLIQSMIDFLPKVMLAGVIMLLGFIIAEMVQNASRAWLTALNLNYANTLANILFGFVFVIVLTVALSQLGIETELLKSSVKIILGALGVTMALALGLGLRGLANAIVSGVYARDIYKPGTEIEMDGELAKITGVGPVTTKLQKRDGGFIMLPNAELINQKVVGQSAD